VINVVYVPTLITSINNIKAISSGYQHSIILNQNGLAYSFGWGLVILKIKIVWSAWIK
jgi:alpha-tubulin suppressor-like RCC1 family protein